MKAAGRLEKPSGALTNPWPRTALTSLANADDEPWTVFAMRLGQESFDELYELGRATPALTSLANADDQPWVVFVMGLGPESLTSSTSWGGCTIECRRGCRTRS